MQEVSEKYNNDSYRERHALSVERLRTLPFEESVEDSYIAYFRLVALFLLEVENVRIQVESGKWDQYNEVLNKSLSGTGLYRRRNFRCAETGKEAYRF